MLVAALVPLSLSLALAQTPPAPSAPPAPPAPPAIGATKAPSAGKARPRVEERVEEEEPVLTGFDRPSGKRFTGDFDDTDVDEAIRTIAEAADWSIVLPEGEHGTISARFKNVAAEEALRAVLLHADLVARKEGAILTVEERSPLARLPQGLARDARRLAGEARREASRALRERGRGTNDRVTHGDVVVRAGETARDVVAIQGTVRVEAGAEVRDAVAVLGSVALEPGARARQAVAVFGDVRLGPGAEVAKDAVSVGGQVIREPSSQIGGETVSIGVPALTGLTGLPHLFGRTTSPVFAAGQILAKFAVFFALGVLILVLFPRRVEVVGASFTANPWKSVLTGFLGLLLAPIVVVLLIATIIGIPLVPVAALLFVAAGVLGFTALAFWVGRALPLRLERVSNVLQLALGTAIVVVVTAIPLLGGLVWFTAALVTFGAVIRSRFGSQEPPLPTTFPPAAAPPPAPPPAPAA